MPPSIHPSLRVPVSILILPLLTCHATHLLFSVHFAPRSEGKWDESEIGGRVLEREGGHGEEGKGFLLRTKNLLGIYTELQVEVGTETRAQLAGVEIFCWLNTT